MTAKKRPPSARIIVKELREQLQDLKGVELRKRLYDLLESKGYPTADKFAYWIEKFSGNTLAPRDPKKAHAKGLDTDKNNCIVQSYKCRAYPTIDSDLRIFEEWNAKGAYFWNAAAKQIQHAIESKDWQRLESLCSSKEQSDYFDVLTQRMGGVPIEIKRDILERFKMAVTKGRANEENKGYPKMHDDDSKRITMRIALNGQYFKPADKPGEIKCTYAHISAPYAPPNHYGARKGKYRGKKTIRKVSLRLNAKSPWLDFDTLFHDGHIENKGCPKDIKLIMDNTSGKTTWFIAFSIESILPSSTEEKRAFAGLDYNWRKDNDSLSIIDIGTEDGERKEFDIAFSGNRRSRRQAAQKSRDAQGLPAFIPTPQGRKAYQQEMDKRKDALKKKWSLHRKIGWKGIRKIADDHTDPRAEDCRAEAEWHQLALRQFAYMCNVEVKNRDREYYKIAQDILAWSREHAITDIGSPNDNFKEMAEEKRKKNLPNYESCMMNVRDRNRQIVAPGRLRQIVEWTLKKAGIRIHRINPWKTSQRCHKCGTDTKTKEKYFKCSGCNEKLHRSDVAVRNAARLARECANSDTHPKVCSRNGKSKPYHGLDGCDEFLKKKKEKKREKTATKQKKQTSIVL